MTKKDGIIIFSILIVAGLLFLIKNSIFSDSKAEKIIIYQNNIQIEELSLKEENDIIINGTNQLIIKDKKADMIWADCPDKLCVKQKAILKKGETIVCLPNKIVVEVK